MKQTVRITWIIFIILSGWVSDAGIFLLFLMIIAELDKLHPPKDKKLVIPKRILPFRFKTFQSEASGQWTSIGKSLTNRYQKFQEEDNKNTIEKEFISPRMS